MNWQSLHDFWTAYFKRKGADRKSYSSSAICLILEAKNGVLYPREIWLHPNLAGKKTGIDFSGGRSRRRPLAVKEESCVITVSPSR